jgi:hypothetical protein
VLRSLEQCALPYLLNLPGLRLLSGSGHRKLRSDDFDLEFRRGRLPGIWCPRHINAILT